jgi:hypothetical protein
MIYKNDDSYETPKLADNLPVSEEAKQITSHRVVFGNPREPSLTHWSILVCSLVSKARKTVSTFAQVIDCLNSRHATFTFTMRQEVCVIRKF